MPRPCTLQPGWMEPGPARRHLPSLGPWWLHCSNSSRFGMSLFTINVNLTPEGPALRGLLGSAEGGHGAGRWEQATHAAPSPLHSLQCWSPQPRHRPLWALEWSSWLGVGRQELRGSSLFSARAPSPSSLLPSSSAGSTAPKHCPLLLCLGSHRSPPDMTPLHLPRPSHLCEISALMPAGLESDRRVALGKLLNLSALPSSHL